MIVAGKQYQLQTHPLRNRGSGAGSGVAACAFIQVDPRSITTRLGFAEEPLTAGCDVIARATAIFRMLT
jgi:hypothetical protein